METKNSPKVFDESRFVSAMMDDLAFAKEIAQLSLADLRKQSEVLEQVFQTGSVDELMRVTHSIRGVSGHVSCLKLHEIATRLEDEIRDGNHLNVRQEYESLVVSIKEGQAALVEFLES